LVTLLTPIGTNIIPSRPQAHGLSNSKFKKALRGVG
jgi:hypothetical protein